MLSLDRLVSFLYMSKHCSISVILYIVRATNSFSAESIFYSPSYAKCDSSYHSIKQNKSLLLGNHNYGCLSTKKCCQVGWFHSISIFQCLHFYFVLDFWPFIFCVIIFMELQYSMFHGTPNGHVAWNAKQGRQ